MSPIHSPLASQAAPDPRRLLVEQLQRQLGRAGSTAHQWITPATDLETFSSGVAALDRLLPGGGLRHGMLVEWLAGEKSRAVEQKSRRAEAKDRSCRAAALPFFRSLPFSSAVTLSLLSAREACGQGGVLVVIDRERMFYPPAAAAWEIDLARLIVVRPQTASDALWAAIQALRSPAVAAMWTSVDRLDDRAFRRLQLAATAGRTLGLLLRPAHVRSQPSWADLQLWVGNRGLRIADCGLFSSIRNPKSEIRNLLPLSSHRRIHIRILRLRGGRPGGQVTLEIDDATHAVREVKEGRRLSAIAGTRHTVWSGAGSRPGLLADSR